jgi:membrane-bound lytic murein transglycosylase D
MIEIKSKSISYIATLTLIVAIPLAGCAQNNSVVKSEISVSTAISKPTVQQENKKVDQKSQSNQNNQNNFFNSNSNTVSTKENNDSEEKREIMEKALELLEDSDKLWKQGDLEGTLDTLDEAYSLLLDANGDVVVSQEKDDLRLLIARRILSVYSSKQRIVNGKGSEIPLIMNADVQKEIASFQGIERSSFIAAYQRSGMFRPVIISELRKAGMPEEFFWLPLVESLFKINAYSRARALGLWQFIPSTGYKFGLNRDEWIDERMDVQKSTVAAIAYLKELHGMFGDWLTALAAYNCGEGRVLRVISRQHINYLDNFWDLYNQLPNETARYVPRFLATLHIVKNPQKYGFDLNYTEEPVPCQTVKVDRIMNLKDIADRIEVSEDVLNLLNPELRHKITPDRDYNLKIPLQCVDRFYSIAGEIPSSDKPRFIAEKPDYIRHKVKRGETIASIARKYHVSTSSIKSHNRIKKNNKLYRGQVLKIPTGSKRSYASSSVKQPSSSSRSSGIYKIRKGDTLLSVARRHNLSLTEIRRLNNLKSDKIFVGKVLKITKRDSDDEVKEAARKSKIDKKVLSSTDLDKLGTNKYIVTKGDNLYSIARKNDINVSKLMELNKISPNETLLPGQILTIR